MYCISQIILDFQIPNDGSKLEMKRVLPQKKDEIEANAFELPVGLFWQSSINWPG